MTRRLFPAVAISMAAIAVLGLTRQGWGQGLAVDSSASAGAFELLSGGRAAPIYVEEGAWPGVARAAGDLADDVRKVSGVKSELLRATQEMKAMPVVVATLGKSALVDQLVAAGKLDVSGIKGKWEASITQVVEKPMAGVERALVIVGSDKRGTIYAIYELSEKLGVSPWHYWADVPSKKREAAYVPAGRWVMESPKVKYRGIFINDEEPAFGPWARQKFGGVNSKMYAHMFELILRLKGNYLWPAMWGKSITEDDPESPRVADEYGIVLGTSHHEPMTRAQKDWTKKQKKGPWNFATNADELRTFWREGIERNKNYEVITTIGMRGDGDEPMVQGGDMAANSALLESIVAEQRKIIGDMTGKAPTEVPQLWALYKEVADYYAHGMRVPDDVTLLWCDDNWGNLRRVPTEEERKRSGGAGIYYHFDYVGGPRSYKWLNTNPLPKVWEQMNTAYAYGADRIWVVNVGDLKPMELPIEFFLKMAWDPEAMPKEKVEAFTRSWAEREFGAEHAAEIAEIVTRYAKYNGWRKPELIDDRTFSQVNYGEAERVVAGWREITAKAEALYAKIAPEYRDAFYQLVLYPTKASATVVELHVMTGRNRLYAKQGRASTNEKADRVKALFAQDKALSDEYHRIAGGKWNHMMAQTRIGYTSWNDPRTNILPKLSEVSVSQAAELGVAVEGSDNAWPGAEGTPELPAIDAVSRQTRFVEVFNRGAEAFEVKVTPSAPWIRVSEVPSKVEKDHRLAVTVDWGAVPKEAREGEIVIARGESERVTVKVRVVQPQFELPELANVMGGLSGPTAFAAERFVRNVAGTGGGSEVRWEKIPGYGRGVSAMAPMPASAASQSPETAQQTAPRLEYQVLIPAAGETTVDLQTGPTLDILPSRGVRIGVAFGDGPVKVIDAFEKQSFADPNRRPDPSSPAIRDWGKWVTDNLRTVRSTHVIDKPGVHTLKIYMIDPGVPLERIVVRQGALPPSYFGPPEFGQ